MKKIVSIIFILCLSQAIFSQNKNDSTSTQKNYRLDEVVVTGSRIPVQREMIPVPISIVNRETIEQSEETNLLPVLMKHVPNLFVTSRGIAGYGVSGGAAGGINLRGFSGGAGRVLILIDGHPQYATIYGHPVADAYIASEAQQVEVSRGAASILYGSNAMGGAINIITRKALEDGNRLSARLMGGSYGTQRYSLTDSYRNGQFSGVASANYERTDGHRTNSGFESLSGFTKLGYEFAEEWKVTGNVNIAKSHSNNPGTASRPMLDGKANVLRGMSGLSVENKYDKTSGAANFFYNWGDHKINDGYFAGGTPRPYLFKSTDYMGGVNIYQSVNLFQGNTITGGFDAKIYGGNAYRDPQTEIYADHIKLHEVAGYLFAQQALGPLMLNAGIRLENHKLYGRKWIPQGGFSLKATEQTHLKFSVSKGFRTPNLRELYMYASANEDLLPESSLSYDFTVSQGLFDNRLMAELTLFYIKGDNIVEVVQVGGHPQNRNAGKFANKGVEVSLNYQILNNLALHSNYSYLHMDKLITGSPRNKFYAGLTYHPGKFSFNAGAQVIGKLYLATENTPQASSYTLVDARVSYQAYKWLGLFVKGDNLLARRYETMLGYPMPRATFMAGALLNL
ncbi:TonB-dependent receptor [Dysgonomonas sp. 25]|uniref:TonB-dependent receptor n=1 Tax=Dysgonomonas sp. 25 TaxID=2302933 RepID=UPI0013D7112B|nr:TonB-dependent receptor [Dysgonomonas sp. 25]